MRKPLSFLVVLTLFLYVPASITWAQTVSSQKGLTTGVFTFQTGTVKVYLPDEIRQGDVISGTVTVKPEGKNDKQVQRNLVELSGYSIELFGQKISLNKGSQVFSLMVVADALQNSKILLVDNRSTLVQQLAIPAKPVSEQKPTPATCLIPSHVLTGSPMTIPGPFDGNSANTQCSINNQPAAVLAESPRNCVVAFPANASGIQNASVKENKQSTCIKEINAVNLDVSAGKLNLLKGEQTYINVKITGLQNLTGPALLHLNNLTTEVVILHPSNNTIVTLFPDSVSTGTFNRQFDVQSIRTGTFTVNVDLNFQDIMMSPDPEDPKKDNNLQPVGNGDKTVDPLVVIEKDDPKNPITYDSLPPLGIACNPTLLHLVGQAMDGGLRNKFVGPENSKTIRRDDFIVLEADGVDFDLAQITCTRIEPCPQPGCLKQIPIEGRVKFKWETTSKKGEENTRGSFAQIGCMPDNVNEALGEHVIFKPPYIPLPVDKKIEAITILSTIRLTVMDAGSPVPDNPVIKTITISITRSKKEPELYTIKISGGEYKRGVVPKVIDPGCPCHPSGPLWTPGDNLEKPEILLFNGSADKNKLIQGQWAIVGTQDQVDMDIATYGCKTICPTTTLKKSYNDVVRWKWKVTGGGRILLSDTSQFIVYEAPGKFPDNTDYLDINITVEAYNPEGRPDPVKNNPAEAKAPAEKVFRIYKGGVKLSITPLTWLPTNNEKESLEVTSTLMIKEEDKWLPAPDHSCRIHYFDLFDVSNEKGVCLNSPIPAEANYCRDLKIKNEKGHEAYDSVPEAGCIVKAGYCMQARTKMPARSYKINIYSEDFGSWGFLRSFANVNEENNLRKPVNDVLKSPGMDKNQLDEYNKAFEAYRNLLEQYYAIKDQKIKQQTPYYTSLPVTPSDVTHPEKKERGKYDYTDNRVSIPLDLDNNHIADNGWIISHTGETDGKNKFKMKDEAVGMDLDNDDKPLGDGWEGDGLSWYEEYRGFMVSEPLPEHHRTNPTVKDLFVSNKDHLPIEEFERITKIPVHQISEKQYASITADEFKSISHWVHTNQRFVNFNSGLGHQTPQKGLFLRNVNIPLKGYVGITPSETDEADDKETPAPPNWNKAVQVDGVKLGKVFNPKNDNPDFEKTKLKQIVAHELCHALNVYHHGEKGKNPGLTSGNINCIMRYDNYDKLGETPGTLLCEKEDGANSDNHRGSCLFQIRVSGRIEPEKTNGYPTKN